MEAEKAQCFFMYSRRLRSLQDIPGRCFAELFRLADQHPSGPFAFHEHSAFEGQSYFFEKCDGLIQGLDNDPDIMHFHESAFRHTYEEF